MFDGIALQIKIEDFEGWKKQLATTAPQVKFSVPIHTDTGEQLGRQHKTHVTYTHRAQFETFTLRVLETVKGGEKIFLLKINGSLHKNHFGGANYQRFTFADLRAQINHLCQKLQIIAKNCKVVNLEFGVNIPFYTSPLWYIDNAVLIHKTKEFTAYDEKDGITLGRYAKHAQYSVKVYDKGLQHDLPTPLLRMELRFVKMQVLNRIGIYNLADLTGIAHTPQLLSLLCATWIEVLIAEPNINVNELQLTHSERELIKIGRYRDSWVKLANENKERFKYQRKQFRALMQQYGNDTQGIILNAIKQEWQQMTNSPNLPLVKNDSKKVKFPEFTVKVKGKNGELSLRRCLACGADISHQRPNSIFCSSKYVGEDAAHKCRNANSNPRNNFKNKIHRLEMRGLLFDVLPYFVQTRF